MGKPAPKGNKYAIGNRGGRPPRFKTPQEMSEAIDSYFEYIKGEQGERTEVYKDENGNEGMRTVKFWKREPEVCTISGLILFLGFHSYQAFDTYTNSDTEFERTIGMAKIRIAKRYETHLTEGKSSRGAAFALGAIVGWGTRTEVSYRDKDGKLTNPPATAIIVTNALTDSGKEV